MIWRQALCALMFPLLVGLATAQVDANEFCKHALASVDPDNARCVRACVSEGLRHEERGPICTNACKSACNPLAIYDEASHPVPPDPQPLPPYDEAGHEIPPAHPSDSDTGGLPIYDETSHPVPDELEPYDPNRNEELEQKIEFIRDLIRRWFTS